LDFKSNSKELEYIRKVLAKYKESLLNLKGVIGVGIGKPLQIKDNSSKYVIIINVENKKDILISIPKQLEGIDLEISEVGELKSMELD